jgi:3'-5' exoribonuclease
MPPIDLARAVVGDRVQHELLVTDRVQRTTQLGDPYLVLTLGNASGTLETSPIWSDHLDWADGAEPGRVVQVLGTVTAWSSGRGMPKRQLTLSGPVRVLPAEHHDAEQFLPRIAVEPVKLWDAIDEWRAKVTSLSVRRAIDSCYADDVWREAAERAPAAPYGALARIGGFLLHTWEVARLAQQIARTMRGAHADLVLAGALLHDIGKLEAYALRPTGVVVTSAGALLGSPSLGARILDARLAASASDALSANHRDELAHLVLAQRATLEGSSPVRAATREAEILQWADEIAMRGAALLEHAAESSSGETDLEAGTGWARQGRTGPAGPSRPLLRRAHNWD